MKKKQRNYWKIALITIVAIFAIALFFSDSENANNNNQIQQEPNNLQKLEGIVQDYHKTHTYSLVDLFVCTDTSTEVWNLVKTDGINAQICVGNIEENFTGIDFFTKMNHAWVMAETEPFKWLALETTGGYLVWAENKSGGTGIENNFYYNGLCFDNPSEFKKFISLRDDYFEICGEANQMIEFWNENYIGKTLTAQDYEFKGKLEAKKEECNNIDNQLVGLLS